MSAGEPHKKGRGAQFNPPNPFHHQHRDETPQSEEEWENLVEKRTEYVIVHPKTMLNKVESPDIGNCYSINPYQGCEHGCVYCYARNTHPYWGYSAGTDFEQKVLVKKEAPAVLDAELRKPGYQPLPIMLAGNTDCYQPAERKFGITRQILEVLQKHAHPVGIITKNSLITRDLDILKPMAELQLAKAAVSLTTLDEDIRRMLEPRTASVKSRLNTIDVLAKAGIPVHVMLAPIIPGLNDHELLEMAKSASEHGAGSIAIQIVRLNGDVGIIFEDWIRRAMPDRADRVLNRIKDCHGGQLNDSRFGVRMRGEGVIADVIQQQFQLAKKLYFSNKSTPSYNFEIFLSRKNPQLKLF